MEINDDVLITYMLGEALPETSQQVAEWINANAANKKQYEQFRIIWDKSLDFTYNGEPNAHASLQRLKQKAHLQNKSKTKIGYVNTKMLWLKIAATILVIAGCGFFYIYQHHYRTIQLASTNAVKVDTLSDGSIVTLNKESTMTYPVNFRGNERKVILNRGEAFFNVAENRAKPFIISSGGTTIRVVGTSFNVKKKASDIEVIVETGIVQITQNSHSITLVKGEKALVEKNSSMLRKEKNPDLLYNYYRSKEFVAENTPLWRMVDVLNEAYNTKIVIARKEAKYLPLNTTFKNESLDNILAIICRTFGTTVEQKDGLIVIK